MLSKLMAAIDRSLRARQHIFEYSSSEACLFRIQRASNPGALKLPDGTCLPPGAPMLALHVWNEHVPPLPASGANLAWARRLSREIDLSLRALAAFVTSRSDLADVAAISATLAFGSDATTPLMIELSGRFGFAKPLEQARSRRTAGDRLHQIGENMLITLLVWSHNPRALRGNTMRRTRLHVYMTRETLIGRFGQRSDHTSPRSRTDRHPPASA
ncbi:MULTISPECIES: hypothetical protein [Bradyrhizobium]|uniref:hypothetical protein n=1 Tax=Bradyrhizobium TaxID=374 RepID=UPI0005500849|nr:MULTISPECIES: hypothetical protein [unclassified Bradyrhizobium]MDA9426022.1 hypothetical protein [Bradyrhizobium sp. CCBAU 53380]